jgi:hypothetical protein
MYWFNTVLLAREELSETFNHPSMKKRYADFQLSFHPRHNLSIFAFELQGISLRSLSYVTSQSFRYPDSF